MINNKKYLSFLLTLILLLSCDDAEVFEIIDNNYSFVDLEYEDLFYVYTLSYFQINPPFNYEPDSNGVILVTLNGEQYYNPVSMSQVGINQFDRYWHTGDSLFLDYAQRHRDALADLMNGNALFEYRINWHHRLDVLLKDPWYSGMAQGQALSLLSRLAFYADDTIAYEMAQRVYETMDFNEEISEDVVSIDNDYAWIEEYPSNPPDHTFNGFMFAIIGLYDYYHLLNNDEEVKSVLSSYLTTVNNNMHLFRHEGYPSYYCLRHHHTDEVYHRIHILQLEYFTTITLDSSFSKFADTLRGDYWDPDW